MSRTVAAISVATGIGPNDLLDCDPEVFAEIVHLLNERSKD